MLSYGMLIIIPFQVPDNKGVDILIALEGQYLENSVYK